MIRQQRFGKLDAESIASIRSAGVQRERLLAHISKELSHETLSRRYGVSVTNIKRVINREIYRGLP